MIAKTRSKIYELLLKYSRKIGLDLPYFIKHSFWITIRYVVVGLFGLLITVGFARLGTKELLGQYQYVISILALLSIFSLPGLNLAALREVTKGNTGAVRQAIWKSFKWSWLAFPIIIGYGIFTFLHGRPLLGEALILAGILFPFFYAPNTWYVFYEGRSHFKLVTARIILSTIIINLALFAGLYAKIGLFWLIAIYFGVNAVCSWFFYGEMKSKMKSASAPLDMKYGLSCTVQKFTFSLTDALPPIVISFIFGFASVAIYQITYLSLSLIAGFVTALSATYLPLLFKYQKLNHKKFAALNLLIGLLMFAGFLIFIRLFFILFYGEQYRASYDLAWIFSFLIITFPLRTYLINFFTSRDKNKLIIIFNLIANLCAPVMLYLTKGSGFIFSASAYLYSLQLIFFLPLLLIYFSLIPSNKTKTPARELTS